MTICLQLITEKLQHWYVHFTKMLPNILLAVVIVAVAIYLAKASRSLNKKLICRINGKSSGSYLTTSIVYLTVIFVGLFIALYVLQLDKAVSSLLAGAGILNLTLKPFPNQYFRSKLFLPIFPMFTGYSLLIFVLKFCNRSKYLKYG